MEGHNCIAITVSYAPLPLTWILTPESGKGEICPNINLERGNVGNGQNDNDCCYKLSRYD